MFANVTKTVKFPSKDQAIIINAIEGATQQDYVSAIGLIVKPQNIRFISRMSNNRIGVFLSSKELVDNLITSHNRITINNTQTEIRRMITPAKRLIISNACPSIPHNVIETALKSSGLTPVSTISFLRAGLSDPDYIHVMSFRRQIYIAPNEHIVIPSSLLISYENTDYRIFISTDGISCHLCKQNGHIAIVCPKKNEFLESNLSSPISLSDDNSKPPTNPKEDMCNICKQFGHVTDSCPQQNNPQENNSSSTLPLLRNKPVQSTSPPPPPPPIPPTIISKTDKQSSSEIPLFQTPTNVQNYKKNKKRKTSSQESLNDPSTSDDSLNSLQDVITKSPNLFILSFEQFKDFIENTHGSPNPINIALNYTSDLKSLIQMMDTLYPLSPKNIKNRLTRIKKKLIRNIAEETGDEQNFSSLSDDQDSHLSYDSTMEH